MCNIAMLAISLEILEKYREIPGNTGKYREILGNAGKYLGNTTRRTHDYYQVQV